MTADSISAPEGATTLTTKETWDAAVAAWEAAKVAFDFADALDDAARGEAGYNSAEPAAAKIVAMLDERAQVENKTRFALIELPAPDFEAVSFKMNLLFGQDYAELGDADEYVSSWHRKFTDAVTADVERLQTEFAEAWLAAWTKDGGAVMVCPDGELQYSFPTFDRSPRYVAPADHMDEQFAARFVQTGDQHYHSTMNARVETLRMIPGGRGMIKSYMRAKGLRVAMIEREQGA